MTFKFPDTITTGDLHLNVPRISTIDICNRLTEYMFPLIPTVKLMTINGDIFDSATALTATDSKVILDWFIQLMKLAEQHNVVIRIIRGTVSHDRSQVENLVATLHESFKFKFNFKYIDCLNLEYIDELDLRVIYIPDNLPFKSTDAIMARLRSMMSDAGWDVAQLILYHGYFEHMLPKGIRKLPSITFQASELMTLLDPKGFIFANHVHSKSVYKQVIGVGSFDRLAHGEEESKGFFHIKDGKPIFIENNNATLFKTINLSKIGKVDDCIERYKTLIAKKFNDPPVGYVRVIHPNIDIRQTLASVTSFNYPYLRYDHMSSKDANNHELLTDEIKRDTTESIILTEENLATYAYNFLQERELSLLTVDMIAEMLEAV